MNTYIMHKLYVNKINNFVDSQINVDRSKRINRTNAINALCMAAVLSLKNRCGCANIRVYRSIFHVNYEVGHIDSNCPVLNLKYPLFLRSDMKLFGKHLYRGNKLIGN